MDDWAERRQRMVREQIAARGVGDDRVLEALRAVPRHLFVPVEQQPWAYADRALPIGSDQTISQPFMVASMTAALAPERDQRVLEVGTGSGYQAAVLSLLARDVVTIERRSDLASVASERLTRLGYLNVSVVVGDGTLGWPSGAPYDRIIVTAGAPAIPDALLQQLAEGGRLVIPVGPLSGQDVLVITRRGERFDEWRGEACVFVPLIGERGWPSS